MKTEFVWTRPVNQIIEEKTKGDAGLLFLANEAKRLMDPYVPANNLVLAQNVSTYVENGMGIVEYKSPYAHYQWEGTLYVSSTTGSSWSRGEFKVPTSRSLTHSKFRHPLATSHWDQAMKTAKMGDLLNAYQNFIVKG